MTPRTRAPLSFPWIALLLLGLLLPLLAACGGTAQPVMQPISDGMAPQSAATPMPASAPHAPEAAAGAPAAPVAGEAVAEAPALVEAPAEAVAIGIPASDASAPQPAIRITPPASPPNPGQQQYTALKAGDVDDNADFAAYLDYLNNYRGLPARAADVSERYILTVVNDEQRPVLDARVRLFAGQRQVFEGRTYAGGKTIVLPRALGIDANVSELRVLLEKGNSSTEGVLRRGQDSYQTLVLPGATSLPERPHLDVLFLLDATGSMGDEIAQIQGTIVSIAERIDRIEPRPEVRFGLVAYRDRGDDYVTLVYDFTPDVATFRQLLLSVSAQGGGDTPESLNEALHAAIQGVHWADDAVRLTFLVADAPPHLDYAQDYDYLQEARVAVARGIKLYPIAASNSDDQAEYVFRQLAQQTLAHFIFLTYQPGMNSGTPGDTTTHHVDPQSFTVERLDDLVVQVVERELAMAAGTV